MKEILEEADDIESLSRTESFREHKNILEGQQRMGNWVR